MPPQRGLDWGDDEAATRVHGKMACLTLVAHAGPLAGRAYGSDGDPMTIGRGSGCAVHLPLAEISRRHAHIRYHTGRFWVEDLQTLNGTWLNDQVIERPAPLKAGDRLRIGDQEFEVRFELLVNRQVVHDSRVLAQPNEPGTAPLQVGAKSGSQPRARPASSKLARLLTLAILLTLLVATAMVFIVVRSAQSSRDSVFALPAATPPAIAPTVATTNTVRPAPVAAPAPPAATATPTAPATTAAAAPIAARVELEDETALTADEDAVVQRALPRGSLVRLDDLVVRLRKSNDTKQKELDRLNARLDEDEDNAELARRARALAAALADDPPVVTLKSSFDGVVVTAAATNARVHAGATVARLARAVRLVLDGSTVQGMGSNCRVHFLDQQLDVDGRRVASAAGAAIELMRFPATLKLDALGRVRADCN
jgi:pSer/pThr/pTyr-binding forkhead associated (FHA) protein